MRTSAARPLSVKEVADVAGVTPRTIRHYHGIGLLPEPPRDSSGYRRYGGKEVVEVVRVTRLRALGMPLPQIAQRIGPSDAGEPNTCSLTDALGALADDLDLEIGRLVAARDRLRALAGSETFDRPAEALARALRDQGVLGPADDLRSGERWAAAVVDALHPEGMPGVLAQAGSLFGDATVVAALRPLRRRLRKLGSRSTEEEISALASDVAAVLSSAAGQVDIGLVDVLLTDRLNPAQQRFMRQLRGQIAVSR